MTLQPSDAPAELVAKYDRSGPRYTSYPTAPVWSDAFGAEAWVGALRQADERADEPIAIYVHLPFCQKRCLFCACNVVITKREDVVEEYLARLFREIDRTAAEMPRRRQLSGLHWGGGTPTHLTCEQLERLYRKIEEHWTILPDAELSIEVHPPVTTREQLETLRRLGFNRISFGVQDMDGEVQELIGRDQTVQQTEDVLTTCRELGFSSVNFDLVYGLPGQSAETWDYTLDQVLRLKPDRLAIYSYAHVPWLHSHQKRMPMDRLPEPELKLELLRTAARRLCGEGDYAEIGFDHFALKKDELARAVDEKRLYRNFMGYTVRPASDYVGFGVTAISEVGNCFAQTHGKLNRWNEALDDEGFAIARGHQLSLDDRVRKLIIERIMCNQWLDLDEVEALSGQPFRDQFAAQWEALAEMEEDGLVERGERHLGMTELGRLFLRNVCMLFDAYLPDQEKEGRFSRTV
jgi:oxygen-independent coproporphyrinogen-3 oxidase